MPNSKYMLRYLPLFYEDLNEKVEYIAFEKLNPTAAIKLVDAEGGQKIMEVRRFLYKGQDRDSMI